MFSIRNWTSVSLLSQQELADRISVSTEEMLQTVMIIYWEWICLQNSAVTSCLIFLAGLILLLHCNLVGHDYVNTDLTRLHLSSVLLGSTIINIKVTKNISALTFDLRLSILSFWNILVVLLLFWFWLCKGNQSQLSF